MFSEGTRISSVSNVTEEEIEKRAVEQVDQARALVIVNYPVRDLDRLITFYKVAQQTGRQLVVSLKQAYFKSFQSKQYPNIGDVLIYQPRRGWGLIDDESFACVENEWMCTSQMDSSHSLRDYRKWERDFLVRDNIIRYKDLQKDPENYLFRSDFFELKELIDIKPEDAVYIKSSTEPFDE